MQKVLRWLLPCVLAFAVLGGLSATADNRPVPGEVCKPSCDSPCGYRDCARECNDLDQCRGCCAVRNWGDELFERCLKRCKQVLGDPCPDNEQR